MSESAREFAERLLRELQAFETNPQRSRDLSYRDLSYVAERLITARDAQHAIHRRFDGHQVREGCCDHDTGCNIWGDDGQGNVNGKAVVSIPCSCGASWNWAKKLQDDLDKAQEHEQATVAAKLRDAARKVECILCVNNVALENGEHVWRSESLGNVVRACPRAPILASIQPSQQSALDRIVADAIMKEHNNHFQFFNDLYATLVDPVAEGSITESKLMEELLQSARWYRQHAHDLETQVNNQTSIVAEKVAEVKREIAAVMREMDSLVQFASKREIESPSNHQEFAREAAERLARWDEALRALPLDALESQSEGKGVAS